MADEVKDVEVVEGAEGAEGTEEKKGKAKKEKKEIDFKAYADKAKDAFNTGSEKMTAVVTEADDKKRFIIFAGIIALEVVLSLLGEVNPLMLIIQILVGVFGVIGLKAVFNFKKDEEKPAE